MLIKMIILVFVSHFVNGSVNKCGHNSGVECNLAKVDVVGSNPIARSRIYQKREIGRLSLFFI